MIPPNPDLDAPIEAKGTVATFQPEEGASVTESKQIVMVLAANLNAIREARSREDSRYRRNAVDALEIALMWMQRDLELRRMVTGG